jgi:ATP-dependent DNA ligase
MARLAPAPPIEPMLAKIAEAIPAGDFLYEPKWDGFRAIVFRGDEAYIQSRDLRPFDRYFPDLHALFEARLPKDCVIDGEIVIATKAGLDFDALQMRLHPAASRVERLARETPASFVAFDLLAANGKDLRAEPQLARRRALEALLADAKPPIYITPATTDRDVALDWLQRFEGAGLDGVIAKPVAAPYQPGKRAMLKIKHARTAECVVAGFRWHKAGPGLVGSLLLGLYDEAGVLHHVGVTSSFTMARRKELAQELEPLRANAMARHPWRDWAAEGVKARSSGPSSFGATKVLGFAKKTSMPGAQSRWSAGKDLAWEPVRIARVCEVKYDHLQGDRFRHAATFLRWRPDKQPAECRYDQLEVATPFRFEAVFRPPRAVRR